MEQLSEKFEKTLTCGSMEIAEEVSEPVAVVDLLRRFLSVQENRAEIYARLKRCNLLHCILSTLLQIAELQTTAHLYLAPLSIYLFRAGLNAQIIVLQDQRLRGFTEYLSTGSDRAYQQLCSEITTDFNDCSKQVIEMESILGSSDYHREDLVNLLKTVQSHEKQKLHMTATIQVLKKAGRPSERLVTHERCQFKDRPYQHQCVHVHELTEASGLEDAEADAEYDAALNEAIRAVQEAVTCINEHVEEIRYEIEELDSRELSES